MLNIINKSPFNSNTLASCLHYAPPNSAILFIEDGVYAAIQATELAEKLKKVFSYFKFYALKPDVETRGILEKLLPEIQLIDYAEFVDLTLQHHPIQTWS